MSNTTVVKCCKDSKETRAVGSEPWEVWLTLPVTWSWTLVVFKVECI
jgi:hypothetical protein